MGAYLDFLRLQYGPGKKKRPKKKRKIDPWTKNETFFFLEVFFRGAMFVLPGIFRSDGAMRPHKNESPQQE